MRRLALTLSAAFLAGVLLRGGLTAPAWADIDPPGCSGPGVSLLVAAFRADGVTPVVGTVSACESIFYQVTIGLMAGACAFSGGTLTLTTPNGAITTLSNPLPCIGGTTSPCTGLPDLQGALVPYTAAPADVVGGTLTAHAAYTDGMVHDATTDTPISSAVSRVDATVACGTQPQSPCIAGKMAAASKFFIARGTCYAKAFKLGTAVDSLCLRKAQATLVKKFVRLEITVPPCATVGDAPIILGLDQSCSDTLLNQLNPTP